MGGVALGIRRQSRQSRERLKTLGVIMACSIIINFTRSGARPPRASRLAQGCRCCFPNSGFLQFDPVSPLQGLQPAHHPTNTSLSPSVKLDIWPIKTSVGRAIQWGRDPTAAPEASESCGVLEARAVRRCGGATFFRRCGAVVPMRPH